MINARSTVAIGTPTQAEGMTLAIGGPTNADVIRGLYGSGPPVLPPRPTAWSRLLEDDE
jgi:hypothetical protein